MTKMTDELHQIDNDEISLKELIQKIKSLVAYLKTQWILIFSIASIGASIGFVNAYRQPIIYKALLTFALEEDKGGGGVGGALGLASSFGFDIGGSAGGAFSGSNLIELMKSRKLIEKTLLNPVEINGEIISVAEFYIRINKLRKAWNGNPVLKNIKFLPNSDRSKFSLQQDSILHGIYLSLVSTKNLLIQQKDKKTSITSIEVMSENENFAKIFCEGISKNISDYYTEIKSRKARLNMEILQFQTDSIRAELNSAITGVAAADDNVFHLNPAMIIKKTTSTRRQLDVQANTAILIQLVAQLEMAKVTLRKETPLIQVVDAPILPLEKDKPSKLLSMIIGGLIAAFLSVLYLTLSKLYKKIVFN